MHATDVRISDPEQLNVGIHALLPGNGQFHKKKEPYLWI
jgi:hypothetical protein